MYGCISWATRPPPLATSVATVYRNCNYDGAVTLPVDDYNLGALQSRGILNDDISSLRGFFVGRNNLPQA